MEVYWRRQVPKAPGFHWGAQTIPCWLEEQCSTGSERPIEGRACQQYIITRFLLLFIYTILSSELRAEGGGFQDRNQLVSIRIHKNTLRLLLGLHLAPVHRGT